YCADYLPLQPVQQEPDLTAGSVTVRCGGSQQQRSQGDHLLLNEADAAQPGGFSGFVTIS
ncbi:unnamed protein product, partial [Cladocopium goreaui]